MKSIRVVARAGVSMALLLLGSTVNGAIPVVDANVVNQPQVRDADHPARHAFQTYLCTVGFPVGCPPGLGDSFIVPADKRLVIEYVSGHCSAQPTTETLTQITVSTIVKGVIVAHRLVPVLLNTTGTSKSYSAAQPMRVYGDPGTTVSASAGGFPAFGSIGCVIAISGTLVNL